jgi:hypothetical protein
VPHAPPHALSALHFPVAGEQYWPVGQVTPLQGCAKQPGMHSPSTQLCPPAQVIPAQGSAMATHVARQTVPEAHVVAGALRHGSA